MAITQKVLVRVLAVTSMLALSFAVQAAPDAAQGSETNPPFERVETLALSPGEGQLSSMVIDPAGKFAYLGTTAGVVKIDLATFERVDVLPGPSARAGVMDPMGEYAYFGLPWAGRVIKIDLNAFAQVDELDLQLGERGFTVAVVDPDGRYAYFGASPGPSIHPVLGLQGNPARVIKVDLETFERVGAIWIRDTERIDSAVIDPAGRYAYFGATPDFSPGSAQVIKVDLRTFEQVDLIRPDYRVRRLEAAAMDPAGRYAYFGTSVGTATVPPSEVIKIDLDTFEQVDAIDPADGGFRSAVIDPVGRYAYFAAAGRAVKIDLNTFERVDAIVLADGVRSFNAATVDPAGEFAYFGDVIADPGLVVKVRIGAGDTDLPGALTPLQPGRLLDTRQPGGTTIDGQFQADGTQPADATLQLQVAGRGGVPADASAVVLNLTVVEAQGAGFVTAWPCDEPRPDASSLNFTEGQTVPNAVIVKLAGDGTVCLFNAQAATDLLADVNGYFPASSGFEPLQPGRLLDTRQPGGTTIDGQFQAQGAPPADGESQLVVGGRAGVPADVAAVVLNVTVVEAQGAGFVTAWPCDEPRPDASSLNFTEGQTVPNAVVAKVSAAGTVCLFNAQASADLLADVNGYFPAGSGFESLQPGRLLDTRQPGGATVDGEFQAQGAQPVDGEFALQVAGRGGVPDGASAVVLNLTVVEAQGAGFVTAWPCDEPRPDASSLNFTGGQTVPNAVVVKLSPAGTVCLFNAQASADLLADVNGYFP